MVRRSARILFEILGALVAGATIAVALVAWRLSAGPIALEFLTPYLEEALSEPDGRTLEIGRTVVVWRGWEANPELRAETVVVRAPDGSVVATVPALAISMSLESLLRGVLAPARVELVEPRVHLVREADGRIRTEVGGPDDRPGDPAVVETVLRELMAPPHRRGPLGQLRRLAVRDATIVVDDRRLGRVWTLPDGDLVFRRGDRGLDGTLSIDVDLGQRRQRLDGTFVHHADDGTTRLELRADVPDPPSLAQLLPELAPLEGAALPLHVDAALDLRSLGTVERVTLGLRGGAGQLVHDAIPGRTLNVSAATARLAWDATAARVELEDLFLDLGGPTVAVTARADGVGAGILADLRDGRAAVRIAAEAAIVDLPTPALWRLWPASVVANGRRWVVANIADGRVRDAQIKVEATLSGGEPRVERLDGVFAYEGLSVTYLNGLPPVRQVHGTARFDDQQMVLDVAGGTLGRQTRVDRSTVRIVDFQKRDQQILIETGTSGPAREALEVIDRPRLGFLARFGLRPADVSGDSTVRMSFAFPAVDSLRMDDVRLKVAATVARGAMPVGVQDWRLTDAELAFDVDKDKLEAKGTGRLQGVPVTLSGREVFAASAPVPSEYAVKGRIDEAARRRLGYDYAPWVRGPTDVDLSYRSLRERRSELSVRADLTPSTLELAPVGWTKPAGQRATAELAVDFQGDQVRRVRGLKVSAPGFAFDGAAEFGAAGWVLDIAAASLGETRLAGRVRPQGNGYAASLRGPLLDLGHFLDAGALDGDGAGGGGPGGQEIHLDARFDRVLLGQGRELTGVAAEIDRDRQGRRRVRLDGRFARGGAVRVAIDPGADGRERLVATTDDFGAVMSTFAGRDTLRDGTLRVEGTFGVGAQRDVLSGTVQASDYRLVRAPAATKILSVLSLTSMVSLLQGDGLPFTDLRFDFTWSKGRLEMRQGRAYGGAIGGTFEGALDFGAETLDIAGTLVPAYTLNNLLGNIPVLGTLLAGGRDEGVFAANYRMAGPLDDPGVSVNALSALAPGILRKIVPFLGAGDPRNGGAATPEFRQDGVRPPP